MNTHYVSAQNRTERGGGGGGIRKERGREGEREIGRDGERERARARANP